MLIAFQGSSNPWVQKNGTETIGVIDTHACSNKS